MQNAKDFSCFYNSLPTAGVSGTLKNLCKNQAGQNRIKAKSGTMTRIKSYAGYVKTTSNKNLAFAIVVNNSTYSRRELKSKIEQLLNAIATY
jgi:D-alanyl-D-alanine carboxypeptidase/D-alanyl-D-alanine-endopeptidase (penicillin-binding protein 4)